MSIPKISSPATPLHTVAKKPLTPKVSKPSAPPSKPFPTMDVKNASDKLNPSYFWGALTSPRSAYGFDKGGASYILRQDTDQNYQVKQALDNGDSTTCTFNQKTGQYMGNVGDNAHNRRTGDSAGTVPCETILKALEIPYQ